jgi:DNA-binding transcriptional LysR family regulator
VSVLAAVVEGGSFVKAAALIGITDSGVSRAISRLEARLNVRLLDRTTRSVILTDEGRRFYEEVRPHLNAIEDAAAMASGATSAVRGRLKVDIDPFFLPLVLAGRLGGFCERYPELSIEFVTSEHVGDLVSEGIDLAIRFGQPRLASLVARKLVEAPILTVASLRYLERYGRPTHPSGLADHRCLQFLDPYTGRPFEWQFIRGKEAVDVPTAYLHRSEVDAARVRRRHGRRPDHRLERGAAARRGRAGRPLPGLARRALPVVRLPSVSQTSTCQGPRLRRFLCRTRHGPLAPHAARPTQQIGCLSPAWALALAN